LDGRIASESLTFGPAAEGPGNAGAAAPIKEPKGCAARWGAIAREDRTMTRRRIAGICAGLCLVSLAATAAVRAADSVSDADKTFVAKVSQGGMYEVELGKLAEIKGATQGVKDQGNTEDHDHTLVGDKLKSIAQANGIDFPSELNADFKGRLDKMRALSGDAFNAAYIEDMKKIHAADGAAFAKEAKSGSNPALKAFAAETHAIVEQHIGELDAMK
jgi:putative membrane protein